ncbi:MAG: hypothetical protein ABI579_05965 [Candidatus Sumerlaeota bacterium]
MHFKKFTPLILCAALCARTIHAQEIPPLILEDEGKIKVTTRKNSNAADKQAPAEPTPNPQDVVVAYADGRILTRAELELRVSNEFERIKAEVQSRVGGIVATTNSGALAGDEADDKREVLAEQQEEIDEAMRKEESLAVQKWVEYTVLAEEARRQGIVITESDFKQRLLDAQAVNKLQETQVENALTVMKVTRADYERGVYDALMIEQLLDKFIELNYTTDDFRKAYDQAPQLYYTPQKFQIAHFAIALDGSESKTQLNNLRALATEVRDQLRKGVDPTKLFEKDDYNRINQGIFGSIPGYFTFKEGALPKVVEYEARKMKVGDTSDVLLAQRQEGTKILPVSFHVIKIIKDSPEEGRTFETAMPALHRAMLQIARGQVLTLIRTTKSHEMITNLTGIASTKLPERGEILKMQKEAQPISLKIDRNKPLVDEKEVASEQQDQQPRQVKKVRNEAIEEAMRQAPPLKKHGGSLDMKIDPALIPTPLPPVTPRPQ